MGRYIVDLDVLRAAPLSRAPVPAGRPEHDLKAEAIQFEDKTGSKTLRLTTHLTIAFLAAANAAIGQSSNAALGLPVLTAKAAGYLADHWTVDEGLPAQIITTLAQTPDGALWCGSFDGLARFDGVRFSKFSPELVPALQGLRILELRCDGEGRLWIEGAAGELVLFEGGQFRRVDGENGLPANQAGQIGANADEYFWLKGRTDNHFYRFQEGRFTSVTYPLASSSRVDRFLAGAGSLRWGIGDQDRAMLAFLGAKIETNQLTLPDGMSAARAGRLFQLQGGKWATTSTHGIYVLEGSRWKLSQPFARPVTENQLGTPLDGIEDWVGNIWVSVYDEGLILCKPDQQPIRLALPDLSPRPFLRTMILGREGDIWIGGNDGLYRLHRHLFQTQPPGEAPHLGEAMALVEDGGGSMRILYRDGWVSLSETGWTFTRHPNAKSFLWAGCTSRDGTVILGYTERSDSDQGYLDKLYPNGRSEKLGELRGPIRVLMESRSGQLWAATESGLWQLDGKNCLAISLPEIGSRFSVRGLAEDAQGRLFAGIYGHGLWLHDDHGKWKKLTTASDPASDEIWGLEIDREGTVWAATDSGLARWQRGLWHAYGTADGELPRLQRSIACDDEQGLWIASQLGMVRVSLNALNALADNHDTPLGSDWFDRSDGLPSASFSDGQSALRKAADGRIWIGTRYGAAVANPKEWQNWRGHVPAPTVAIEAVMADDHSVAFVKPQSSHREGLHADIGPGTQRVVFRYGAADLTPGSKIRMRYRLEGFDHSWTGGSDKHEAIYHQLPPGKYQFQVMAATRYGLWTPDGATVSVLVRSHFWQTLWFKVGTGIFIAGILWLSRVVTLRQLHRERARREQFSLRLIESQESERKRIARELHDSLGQDLILIKNAAKLTLRKFDTEPPLRERLNEMAELAAHALTDARAITSNLRPPELDRLGLTAALEAMIEKHAAHLDIQLTAMIENVNELWSADQEIHVYRIVQESLNNALKHANPQHIKLSVKVQNREVQIHLQDDGSGFDLAEASVKSAGIGLAGLRERVRILGGTMELTTARGAGTTIHCQIPITVYDQNRHDQNPDRR